MSGFTSPSKQGSYTSSKSVSGTPKSKPQASRLPAKAADAKPKATSGGF